MNKLVNKMICGDALKILKQIPSESIDCVVTSPPYWALRDYETESQIWDGDTNCEHKWVDKKRIVNVGSSDKSTLRDGRGRKSTEKYISRVQEIKTNFCLLCGAWCGSLGLEPIFDLYIKHLCDIFDGIKRVLKKTGTCWVNLGDTYSGSCQGASKRTEERISGKRKENLGSSQNYLAKYGHALTQRPPSAKTSVPNKSLCLIPFRFATEMVNRGWILRNVIIWHKPNCMPASVKDRFTVDFEYVFFFVKNKKYWFATQYEPYQASTYLRVQYGTKSKKTAAGIHGGMTLETQRAEFRKIRDGKGNGRNKRCVWTITTKPFNGAHFAVYPKELVETPIKAGCPERGVVLDPFAGSGTTLLVAKKLGRNYIGIDINAAYVEMGRKRVE